jgi:hypothetical protein
MMAKKLFAVMTILAVVLMSVPVSIFAQVQPRNGVINGTAMGPKGEVLANTRVQLRDMKSKQLVGTTTTNAQGRYEFTNLPPSDYVVEIVDRDGAIIGTTALISLTPAAMTAAGVTVTATAAGAIAAGAAAGTAGAAAAAGGAGAFFGTTAGILTAVAIAGGVTAGVLAAKDDASPSR